MRIFKILFALAMIVGVNFAICDEEPAPAPESPIEQAQ